MKSSHKEDYVMEDKSFSPFNSKVTITQKLFSKESDKFQTHRSFGIRELPHIQICSKESILQKTMMNARVAMACLQTNENAERAKNYESG